MMRYSASAFYGEYFFDEKEFIFLDEHFCWEI
jgi:hypothetical protein